MIINSFKINGFGKLKDKEIKLEKDINIIYGENETGKSSMLKFISSMFYGASKNKNGKDIPDFDKFKPWKSEEFSGKIRYTLDNNKTYEIFREFKKKNPIVYNENMDDISKQYEIDKTKGIDFLTQQTGIDEDTFYSTAITEQEGIRLSKSSQSSIVQKISNMVSSGDDNISYKKIVDKISKMQNEQVGTDRTFQRPINIVENKINNLKNKKKELESAKDRINENVIQREELGLELEDEKKERDFLKELKQKLEEKRLRSAELNFNKNLDYEYDKKVKELNNKINEDDFQDIKKTKINLKQYYIILLIFIISFVCILLFSNNKLISIPFIASTLITSGVILRKKLENNKNIKNNVEEVEDIKNKVLNEIEILKENKEMIKKEFNEKNEKLEKEFNEEKNIIIDKYKSEIDNIYLERYIDKDIEYISQEIEKKETRINSIFFKIQMMENDIKNINEKIEELASIEEQLHDKEIEKEELIFLNNSFNIAKECLDEAYMNVKQNISPKFISNLCDTISEVSEGRYKKVNFNDDIGLIVEIDNGDYISVSRLSVGTIDQMYLSLRLSALSEISKETMPIILDEAFVYFDDIRLRNILKHISRNYPETQVIIFTCSYREKDVLDSMGIKYNLIHLEK